MAEILVAALSPIGHIGPLLNVTRGLVDRGDRVTVLTTAGRHPRSDIFLDDITVSRRHVEVSHGPSGEYVLRDVGSLNGTYVNRHRIDEITLTDGDEVQIGKFKLVFFTGRSS